MKEGMTGIWRGDMHTEKGTRGVWKGRLEETGEEGARVVWGEGVGERKGRGQAGERGNIFFTYK